MRIVVALIFGLAWLFPRATAAGWKLDSSAYLTRWASTVSASTVAGEYPRPTLVRPEWQSLNGLWECGFTSVKETNQGVFNNQILVPFPVESTLAGTHEILTELQRLWYRHTFTIPPDWQGRRIWLHFEAVDWEARVWVNGHVLGVHQGGYDRFSFDITDVLKPGVEQELIVSVCDPADAGSQPRGKQMLSPRPPFYHASSGIWETVWLEPVSADSIESLNLTPDLDNGVLNLTAVGTGKDATTIKATAFAGTQAVGEITGQIGQPLQLNMSKIHPWSPDNPYLYNLKVTLRRNGQVVDEVKSYFGMRKISVGKGKDGYPRLLLNNKALFELGVLDQGYWPEGVCSAPNDEALRADVELIKKLGFNLCRKHVKVEPERWYYWCDKLGVLVWQDMPSGDRPASASEHEIKRTKSSAEEFEQELKQMIVGRGNHPCIVMWIAFNQGWGQYDTKRITQMIKTLDPSRLVADVSGWYDFAVGDVRSLHQYPGPPKSEHDGVRACVVGECGGLGLGVPGHEWGMMTYWNTTPCDNKDQLTEKYEALTSRIADEESKNGLAGAVISQLTDVESEDDGLVTYDREVLKMPIEQVRAANQKVLAVQPVETDNTSNAR